MKHRCNILFLNIQMKLQYTFLLGRLNSIGLFYSIPIRHFWKFRTAILKRGGSKKSGINNNNRLSIQIYYVQYWLNFDLCLTDAGVTQEAIYVYSICTTFRLDIFNICPFSLFFKSMHVDFDLTRNLYNYHTYGAHVIVIPVFSLNRLSKNWGNITVYCDKLIDEKVQF